MLRPEVDCVVANFALLGRVCALVWYIEICRGVRVDWVAEARVDRNETGALVRLNYRAGRSDGVGGSGGAACGRGESAEGQPGRGRGRRADSENGNPSREES